jgi:hypothetical protein
VAWHTDGRRLEKHGVPREFTTTSRAIIICNDSAVAVHRKAGEWFKDWEPEIYDWFGKNLHRMVDRPSVITWGPAS